MNIPPLFPGTWKLVEKNRKEDLIVAAKENLRVWPLLCRPISHIYEISLGCYDSVILREFFILPQLSVLVAFHKEGTLLIDGSTDTISKLNLLSNININDEKQVIEYIHLTIALRSRLTSPQSVLAHDGKIRGYNNQVLNGNADNMSVAHSPKVVELADGQRKLKVLVAQPQNLQLVEVLLYNNKYIKFVETVRIYKLQNKFISLFHEGYRAINNFSKIMY